MLLAGFEELMLYIQYNGVDEGKEGGIAAAAAAAALCVATLKARYEKQRISARYRIEASMGYCLR